MWCRDFKVTEFPFEALLQGQGNEQKRADLRGSRCPGGVIPGLSKGPLCARRPFDLLVSHQKSIPSLRPFLRAVEDSCQHAKAPRAGAEN